MTTSTDCPDNDGLFHATSHNYTYQIQCSTTYTGQQIITQPILGFIACISECATYNHVNSSSTSFCDGVNFNAETDGGDGDCTLFDEVSPTLNQASEEGSIEDAALLIYGSTGQVFATPEIQPSNVVGGLLTNSPVFTPQPVVPLSSVPVPISTALVTSVVSVISCAPGVSNCPANGLFTSTSILTTSALLIPAMTTSSLLPPVLTVSSSSAPASQSISISLGGMRPLSESIAHIHSSRVGSWYEHNLTGDADFDRTIHGISCHDYGVLHARANDNELRHKRDHANDHWSAN